MITETIHETLLLIGGASIPASSGQVREILSPANGEVVGTVPEATAADIDHAVESAQGAFLDWSKRTAYERERQIKQATAYVRTQADEIGHLMAREQGKPFNQSRKEILSSCDTLDYFAAEGVRLEGYTNATENPEVRSWVVYQPVGVCAFITPWNYPVSLLSWKLGPALAVGCAAVVKPTSVTPMSPTAFCKALIDGGLPAGLVNVVTGKGSVVGEALIRHPLVKKVAMTGSTETGKRLMEVYGPRLGKISLELGGHCPAIVCADADLDRAAQIIAYKGFRNLGQSCSSINRVYAHRRIHDELVEKLVGIAQTLRIGDGVTDGSVDLGPMATADGLETVKAHIQDALAQGATLAYGGQKPKGERYERGHYFLPTVLTGATPAMRMMREETFGPVVPFVAFDDLDDAIAQANDTPYGLVSYLFTRDYATTVQVSERLEAGTVCVNNGAVNTNYGPYAGWKESGYGLELSRKAIFEYLSTKHIKVQFS